MKKLQGIKACVFDALGTLVDEVTSLQDVGRQLVCDGVDPKKLQQVLDIWPDKILEYLWLRSVMGALCAPGNPQADALDYAMNVAQLDDREVRRRLLDSHRDVEFFSDVEETLQELRKKGFKTAILSGSSPANLRRLVEAAELEDAFDAVFSATAVDAVKPDPRTYQIAVDELGIAKQEICFVSGNPWDAAGAAYFGFHVIPVIRPHQVILDEVSDGQPEDPRYLPELLPEHPHLPRRMHEPMGCLAELSFRISL